MIVHGLTDEERKAAYAADVTYGTNNEFGFDYLRDNMKFRIDDMVQRPMHYAIVDEVDSILIDEARTPLIISGPAEGSTERPKLDVSEHDLAWLIYTGLATRALHVESRKVEEVLQDDLEGARELLALIVGRETGHLQSPFGCLAFPLD